jgi:hypothetical protein
MPPLSFLHIALLSHMRGDVLQMAAHQHLQVNSELKHGKR